MRLANLIILFTLFSCEAVIAQIDTYPIEKYKRPELHRKTLVFDGGFFSSNRFISNEEDDVSNQSFNFDLNYREFSNTENIQKTTTHITNTDISIDFESDNKLAASIFHSTTYDVRRFNSKGHFFGYNPNLRVTGVYNKNQNFPNRNISISLPVGIGKGRIEIINDAWLATSILQSLKKEGKLKREPTHDEITAFAEEIARIKNARVLDFRRKRIYELDEIYKYIVDLGLVDENTLAFAILYDAWAFEIFDTRRSGSSLQTYISPSYSHNFLENQLNSSSGEWTASYANFKPLNLKLERSYSVFVSMSSRYISGQFTIPKTDQIKNNFTTGIGASYALNYYLSRRTYFSWDNNISYLQNTNNEFRNILVQSTFRFVNWISPQTRLIGVAGINTDVEDSEFIKRTIISPTISFSVQHSIF